MQIVIVGAGTVGFDLAMQLQKAKHDVSLVEKNAARCAEVAEKLDILVVQGTGTSPRALAEAGLREAEMVLAVTSNDDVNILVCSLARQWNVANRIARIRNPEFGDPQSHVDLAALGVTSVIDPERLVVRIIDQIARIPDVEEVFGYHEGKVLVVRHIMRAGMPLIGRTLAETSRDAGQQRLLAVALRRGGDTRIPGANDTFEPGDDYTTVMPRESLPTYLSFLGLADRRLQKAIVAGDGLTAILLCQSLRAWVADVTLIDPSPGHSRRAAERLDGVEVIQGNPTERDILREVNTRRADLFVGAGRNTTLSVMSALLARSEGVPTVVAVSYEPQSNQLFREVGVGHVVSPRRVMAQEIMDQIHRGRISMEMHLRNLSLESIELRAGRNAKILRAPLSEAWKPLRQSSIVGAVVRHDETIIPGGNTQIQEGDGVIVLTHPKSLRKIEDLFRAR